MGETRQGIRIWRPDPKRCAVHVFIAANNNRRCPPNLHESSDRLRRNYSNFRRENSRSVIENICPTAGPKAADFWPETPFPALAHSWYPLACCGNMDCFPVACDQLVETGSGWFYVPTGNLFRREQVQPSQDHHCHVCLGHGGDHGSICAFVVPNV